MSDETDGKVKHYPVEPHARKEARRFVQEFKDNCGYNFDAELEGEIVRELEEFLDGYTQPQPAGEPAAWRKDE